MEPSLLLTIAVEPSSNVTGTRSLPLESELGTTGVASDEVASEGVASEEKDAAEDEPASLVGLLSAGVLEDASLASGTATLPAGHPTKAPQASGLVSFIKLHEAQHQDSKHFQIIPSCHMADLCISTMTATRRPRRTFAPSMQEACHSTCSFLWLAENIGLAEICIGSFVYLPYCCSIHSPL